LAPARVRSGPRRRNRRGVCHDRGHRLRGPCGLRRHRPRDQPRGAPVRRSEGRPDPHLFPGGHRRRRPGRHRGDRRAYPEGVRQACADLQCPRRESGLVTSPDYTVLVVDDSEHNRYTLTRRLAREGYRRVLTASDGRQALELLGREPVDLVLLDIMMPELNGYEVLERLKADERLRAVPVIMISAVDQIESVIRCVELGAEDYLSKPFNPTLLRARVGASLEKKRLRDEIVAHRDRMARELASAREIQLGMVPTDFPPATPGRPVEIYATLQPARQVGGDLYDFFW